MKPLAEQIRQYFDQLADPLPAPFQRSSIAPRRSRRRLAIALAAGIVGLVGLVSATVVTRDGSIRLTTSDATSTSSRLGALSIPLSAEQAGGRLLAAAPDSLWLVGEPSADGKSTSVYRFGLGGTTNNTTVLLSGQVTSIAAESGSVWAFTIGPDGAPTDGSTALVRIDGTTGRVAATIPFPASGQVTAEGEKVWVVSAGDLYEIDTSTNRIGRKVGVGTGVFAATDGASIWVASPYDGRVAIVDSASFVVHYADTGRTLGPVAAAAGVAWIIDQHSAALVRVGADGSTGEQAVAGKIAALASTDDHIVAAVGNSLVSMRSDGKGGVSTLVSGNWQALSYEPRTDALYALRAQPAELMRVEHS